MSISHKCGVLGVDSISLHSKSGPLIKAIQAKLKMARAHLSHRQFEALVGGYLDVEGFLKHVEFETTQEKFMKKYTQGGRRLWNR